MQPSRRKEINKAIELFSHPVVPPVVDVDRPFWSVMIPAFNRPDLLERTLKSVMLAALDPSRMQIEVIENSPPNPANAEVIARVGKGRILHYPQPVPVPLVENWNTCIRRSRGHWVHILHDDDFVMPEFYAAYEAAIVASGCQMISGPIVVMDDQDRWISAGPNHPVRDNLLFDYEELGWRGNPFPVCATVIAREIYETAGGFSSELGNIVDWEEWMNCARLARVAWMPRPYAIYRTPPPRVVNDPRRHLHGLEEMNLVIRKIRDCPNIDAAAKREIIGDLRQFKKNYIEGAILCFGRRHEFGNSLKYLWQYVTQTPMIPGALLGLLLRYGTAVLRR